MPSSDFSDRYCIVFACFTGHAANAIVRRTVVHGVLLAIFLNKNKGLYRAILNAVAAPLTLFKVYGDDEHMISKFYRPRMKVPDQISNLV